jgi:hypothetical protein
VGECEEVEAACISITTGKNKCETPGAAGTEVSCFWLEGDSGATPNAVPAECVDVNTITSCEVIINSAQCSAPNLSSLDGKCIWVENEDNNHRCQEMKGACNVVDRPLTCGKYGTVVVGSDAVECVWLEGKGTGETQVSPRCAQKVYWEDFLLLRGGVSCVVSDVDVLLFEN